MVDLQASEDTHTNLLCCDKCRMPKYKNFHKVAELKNSGLHIYKYIPEGDEKTDNTTYPANEKRQCVVLENTTGKALQRNDFIKEMCQYKTKCFKCKILVSKVQSLLDKVNTIKQNEVVGVCQFCSKYNERGNCKRCEAVIGKFLENRLAIEHSQIECIEKITNNLLGFLKSIFDHDKICNHVRDKCILKSNELQQCLEHLTHFTKHSREIEITGFPDAYSKLESGSFVCEKVIKNVKDELDMMQNKMNVLEKRFNIGDITKGHVKDTDDNTGSPDYMVRKTLDAISTSMKRVALNQNNHEQTQGKSKLSAENMSTPKKEIPQKEESHLRNDEFMQKKALKSKLSKEHLDQKSYNSLLSNKTKERVEHKTRMRNVNKNIVAAGLGREEESHLRNDEFMQKKALKSKLSKEQLDQKSYHSLLSNKTKERVEHKTRMRNVNKNIVSAGLGREEESHLRNDEFMQRKALKSKLTKEHLDQKNYHSSLPNKTKERVEHITRMRNVNKNIVTAGLGRKEESHLRNDEFMQRKALKSKFTKEQLDQTNYHSSLANKSKERVEHKTILKNVNKNVITAGLGRKPLDEKITVRQNYIQNLFTIDEGLREVNVRIKNKTQNLKKNAQVLTTRKVKHNQELDHVSIETVDSKDIAICIENNSQRTSKIIDGNEIVPLKGAYQEDLNVPRTISDNQLRWIPLVEKSVEESCQHMAHPSSETMISPCSRINTDNTQSINDWAFSYKLSDPYFIDNGWTQLPKESIVKEIYIFRMIPTDSETNWFTMNKARKLIPYDNGTIFAKFETNGNCKIFYKNGNVALEYYNSRDDSDGCRLKVFSSGEIINRKQVLAIFDYNGNGIVYDDNGIMRLKYNQRHGVIVDKNIGVPRRWKWQWCGLHEMKPKLRKVYQELHDDTADHARICQSDKAVAQIEISNALRDIKQNNHIMSDRPRSLYDVKVGPFQINNKFKLKVVNQSRVILSFMGDEIRFKMNVGLKLLCDEIVERFFVDINDCYTPFEKQYFQINDDHLPRNN